MWGGFDFNGGGGRGWGGGGLVFKEGLKGFIFGHDGFEHVSHEVADFDGFLEDLFVELFIEVELFGDGVAKWDGDADNGFFFDDSVDEGFLGGHGSP